MLRALVASTVVLWGCAGDERALEWEYAFEDGLRARAVLVDVQIVEGGCEGGRSVYAETLALDGARARPVTLGPGFYGFRVRARDASCVWFAHGCNQVSLPSEETRVRVTLGTATDEEEACPSDRCTDGRCSDAELDAAVVPTDAGMGWPDTGIRVDAGPRLDAGPGVPAPELLWPWNGYTTGSWWDTSSPHAPRRPRLRWRAAAGVSEYEVQLSSRCTYPGFASCDFAGAITARTAGTEWQSPTDLPELEGTPKGRRYAWRVCSCDAVACNRCSAPRWMDVARLDADVDGDGRGDVVAGSPGASDTATEAGSVITFRGAAGGVSTSGTALPYPDDADGWFGAAIATGDLNGDGFADAVIGAPDADGAAEDVGEAWIVFGSASGLTATGALRLSSPSPALDDMFGEAVAIPGDVDGDGFRDVVVGAGRDDGGGTDTGAAYLYLGAAAFPTTPARTLAAPAAAADERFGFTLAPGGDVDGNGFADLIVGAPWTDTEAGGDDHGMAYVLLGSGGAPLVTVFPVAPADGESIAYYGHGIAGGCDFDADGFSDAAIGAPYRNRINVDAGAVTVVHGGERGFVFAAEIPNAGGETYGHAGWGVACGDFDGDGFDDLAVGEVGDDDTYTDEGAIAIWLGGPLGLAAEAFTIDVDPSQGDTEIGRCLAMTDLDGDGAADLLVGNHLWDGGWYDSGRVLVYLGTDGLTETPGFRLTPPSPESSGRFGFALPGSVGRATNCCGSRPERCTSCT